MRRPTALFLASLACIGDGSAFVTPTVQAPRTAPRLSMAHDEQKDFAKHVAAVAIASSVLAGVLSWDVASAEQAETASKVGDSSQVVAPVVVTPFGGGFGGMGFGPFGFNPFGGFGFGFGMRWTPPPPPPPSPDVALERSKAALEVNKERQAQLEQQIEVLEQQRKQQQEAAPVKK